jgi:AcrR family transcriptional regulator
MFDFRLIYIHTVCMLQSQRRTQSERHETTRAALLKAARAEFVARGYQEASTARMVDQAQVTRGALYHHFPGKIDVFDAVVEAESRAVAVAIGRVDSFADSPTEALIAGLDAYFEAMNTPGRTKLLLIEGPAVLGQIRMREIERNHDGSTLVEGLGEALGHSITSDVAIVAELLSGTFERGALMIANGSNASEVRSHTKQFLQAALGSLQ